MVVRSKMAEKLCTFFPSLFDPSLPHVTNFVLSYVTKFSSIYYPSPVTSFKYGQPLMLFTGVLCVSGELNCQNQVFVTALIPASLRFLCFLIKQLKIAF